MDISWKQNSHTKRKIKEFIRAELAKINIDRYHQYDITKNDIENRQASIQISAWNYNREDPKAFECVGYSKEELENVINGYIDTVKSHFKELGISILNKRETCEYQWRNNMFN